MKKTMKQLIKNKIYKTLPIIAFMCGVFFASHTFAGEALFGDFDEKGFEVLDWLKGNFILIVGTIAIVGIGVGYMFDMMSLPKALKICFGILICVSAASIMQALMS